MRLQHFEKGDFLSFSTTKIKIETWVKLNQAWIRNSD